MKTVKCPRCAWEFDLEDDEVEPNPPEEIYYTLAELQHTLGLSRVTLKRLCQSGELPATKIGKQRGGAPWRVAKTDLDLFIRQRRREYGVLANPGFP
jgi:excisionase family DNA binding protein